MRKPFEAWIRYMKESKVEREKERYKMEFMAKVKGWMKEIDE